MNKDNNMEKLIQLLEEVLQKIDEQNWINLNLGVRIQAAIKETKK